MIELFSLTCSVARLGFEAQNAAAFRLLRAAAGASKAISDEIIREEMALIPEKSRSDRAVLEESSAAIAPKRRPTASKMAHKKSAPVKRGKR